MIINSKLNCDKNKNLLNTFLISKKLILYLLINQDKLKSY